MLYFIKFIYHFFLPPGIFIFLLLLLSLWLYKRDQKAALLLAVISFCLYFFSTPYTGNLLISTLESRYYPPSVIKGDVIIMLGGGATLDTPDLDGKGHLLGSAANRLLTTARLYRKTGLPIILSGGQVYPDSGNEALIAKRQLIGLGVPENKIIVEDTSRNTTENARKTKIILNKHQFTNPILITSAFHMERAIRNFRAAGISVIPYPTDYTTSTKQNLYPNNFVPSHVGLNRTGLAAKEYLGLAALALGMTF